MRLFLCFFLFVALSAFHPNCNNSGIKKIWLFSQTQTGGTVRQDADGNKINNRINTSFLIIEVKKNNPISCDSIMYNGKIYGLRSTQIMENNIFIGSVVNDKLINISTSKNRRFIRLDILNVDFILNDGESYELTLLGKVENEKLSYSFNKTNFTLLPTAYQ